MQVSFQPLCMDVGARVVIIRILYYEFNVSLFQMDEESYIINNDTSNNEEVLVIKPRKRGVAVEPIMFTFFLAKTLSGRLLHIVLLRSYEKLSSVTVRKIYDG